MREQRYCSEHGSIDIMMSPYVLVRSGGYDANRQLFSVPETASVSPFCSRSYSRSSQSSTSPARGAKPLAACSPLLP